MFGLARSTRSTRLWQRLLTTEAAGSPHQVESGQEHLISQVQSEVAEAAPANSPIASTSHLPAALLSQHPVPVVVSKHGYHVATLQFRSYTAARPQLEMAVEFARRAAHALKIPVGAPASLPITTELLTVPRGPFVHKKSQENFWRRTHRRAVKVWDADEQVVQVWLEYLKQNPVPGVGIKVQQMLYRPVGFGEDIKESNATSSAHAGGAISGSTQDKKGEKPTLEQVKAKAQEVAEELNQQSQ